MKDSRQYSKKVQRLYRRIKQDHPAIGDVTYEEPVDALVYAIVSENLTEAQTQAAIKRLRDHFVDWNDLRVAMVDEIAETLGPEVGAARSIGSGVTGALRAVFEKYNMLSLQTLAKLGKRPAKQVLEKFGGVTHFVVDYCMLTALDSHAIPLTGRMIEYLKSNGLVRGEADYEEIEGFLARQVPAKNAYEFYSLLRNESERAKTQRSRRAKQAKKT